MHSRSEHALCNDELPGNGKSGSQFSGHDGIAEINIAVIDRNAETGSGNRSDILHREIECNILFVCNFISGKSGICQLQVTSADNHIDKGGIVFLSRFSFNIFRISDDPDLPGSCGEISR